MLQEHFGYLSDSARLEQYAKAIRAAVRSGDRVADLGCGTGILGLLCLKAGAGHVYAIDDSAMLHSARTTLTEAGYGGRAFFIQGRCQHVELPEQVDVAIADHVGFFGFDYGIVELFQDARRRLLKPGGTLIPARLHLQLAAVESPECQALVEGWRSGRVPAEFTWLRTYALNAKHAVNLKRGELLGAPAELGTIDLRADDREFFSWTVELRAERDGIVHGLGGWFECDLYDGVAMTNSPLADTPLVRSQAFLPIGEAVPVRQGHVMKATIMARPADDLLCWIVEFPATGQRFSQSTWEGIALAPEDLQRSKPDRVPRLARLGLARRIILGYCDGQRTAREIEQAVAREHPGLFPSPRETARYVARVLGSDTE